MRKIAVCIAFSDAAQRTRITETAKGLGFYVDYYDTAEDMLPRIDDGSVPPALTWDESLPAPPSIPSACLSAPDFPSGSDDPESDDPESEDPDPEDGDDAAPLALALELELVRFLAVVVTLSPFVLTLRESFAFVTSFSTEIANDPPTATLPPAAAASAVRVLVISLLAAILMSPAHVIFFVPDPSFALVSVPVTRSESTGVTEIPPADPAAASTLCVSEDVADISIPERSLVIVIGVLSSISAMVSIPVTCTAIPAPTPALLDVSLP